MQISIKILVSYFAKISQEVEYPRHDFLSTIAELRNEG